MTADEVTRAVVEQRHPEIEGEWLSFREVAVEGRRLDLLSLHLWGDRRLCAYEVKTARPDWLCELRHPEKRVPGVSISHEFSFVAPYGIIGVYELPPEAGLIEVLDSGEIRVTHRPPHREPVRELTMQEMAALLRAEHAGPDVREWRERARRAEFEVKILREALDRNGNSPSGPGFLT